MDDSTTIRGAGPVARETARRIACDCCITVNTTSNGEPVNIGRKSRLWPAAMARAIKDRDQHCQFPGCTHTQNLQIHHIRHWADNGETSIENGVCICSYHHTLLHEGGYTIQRIANDEQILNEQFTRQKNTNDPGQFDFERSLRNNKDSFETVRKLSPTRYRFRVVNAEGQDICDRHSVSNENNNVPVQSTFESSHSTRVYCARERGIESSQNADDDFSTRVHCAEPRTARYLYAIRTRHGLLNEKNAGSIQRFNFKNLPQETPCLNQPNTHHHRSHQYTANENQL